MGILSKLFGGVSREELIGLALDETKAHLELSGETDFPRLFRGLTGLLSDNAILYFEGGAPDGDLRDYLARESVAERCHLALGTIWPRPKVFHLPASLENLRRLEKLTHHCATPELAMHFHVYQEGKILLQWFDAFSDPMLLAGSLDENAVRTFSESIGMKAVWKQPNLTSK